MKKKNIASVCLATLVGLSVGACGTSADLGKGTVTRIEDNRTLTAEEYTYLNTVGTDALGRRFTEADGKKSGTRYVGIWYSLWLGQHAYMQSAIYDNTKLLATEEGAKKLASTEDCEETRLNEFHFCSEPLYGYYNMKDKWVVARHIELLTAAGVDYLCFDTTNAIVYQDVATIVLDMLMKYKNQGFNVPKAMFYVNSNSGTTFRKIYNEFYQTEKYDDIWFSPNGKPLICGVTSANKGSSDQVMANPTIPDPIPDDQMYKDRFDIRESQWPQGIVEDPNALPWMSWQYPQNVHENLKAISVSVAQHDPSRINFSHKGPHSSRGYDHVTRKLYEDYTKGQNFASQWKTVFDYEKKGTAVENVLMASWNEWMAIKTWNGNETVFCDVYDEEYSRDMEMSKGECGDNFYMQMMQNVRQYKLMEAKHYKYQKRVIDMEDAELSQWTTIKTHYRDFQGDARARDYIDAVGKGRYQDFSNRNDITDVKVVHSSTDLYFYVQTAEAITEHNPTDTNWMNLYVNTNKGNKSFEGYDFIINRSPDGSTTSVEKSTGGFNWTKVGDAEYKVYGNIILYKIPLATLGLTADDCYIHFKVADNLQKPDDIMDYYISGDVAPIGRMSYSYGY